MCNRPLTDPESIALGVGKRCQGFNPVRWSKSRTVCDVCKNAYYGKDCPTCKNLDPFDMPPVKEDNQ